MAGVAAGDPDALAPLVEEANLRALSEGLQELTREARRVAA